MIRITDARGSIFIAGPGESIELELAGGSAFVACWRGRTEMVRDRMYLMTDGREDSDAWLLGCLLVEAVPEVSQ